ncbi:MAG: hypothetical protein LBP98_07915 [Tannerella sp.]|jgi:hypothetical protein|nr:hypothetical protein [Tannerella sp.]
MKTTKTIIVLLCSCLAGGGCTSRQDVSGNYSFKTECFESELDGTITVKAWGNGRNYFDACEQAGKNAVRDVIFNGITDGKSDCHQRPLVLEVNAKQKYEDYFNRFFAGGGAYRRYVSLRDERIDSKLWRSRKRARQSVTHGIVLRIKRADLKRQLIADGIIK